MYLYISVRMCRDTYVERIKASAHLKPYCEWAINIFKQ